MIGQTPGGRVEDIAVCNSLELARRYADRFAMSTPPIGTVRILESRPVEVQAGRWVDNAVQKKE